MITMKKGQNPLLSHSLVTGILVLLVLATISIMSTLTDDYAKFVGENEITLVCSLVKSGVEKIFSEENYKFNSNTTKGIIYMNLPEKIGNAGYRLRFIGSNLSIETARPNLNETCKIGFNATYEGSAGPGRIKIEHLLLDYGENKIMMSKV